MSVGPGVVKFIQPDVISHCDAVKGSRNAIYSLDFQYGGARIATGGGDMAVKVWDVESLLSSTDPTDNFLLATLINHTKSVNVVRWSRDGQFLASGSDDCYILVYELASDNVTSSQPFGATTAPKNRENWCRSLSLHGHTMDVLDLDWSVRGVLASASIDNTVLIWSDLPSRQQGAAAAVSRVLSPTRVLNDHCSFVKGISFDPFGHFLASSSADNRIIVWSCETWTVSTTLKDTLENAVDRSIFRRISWAPDGGSLCVTAGAKNGKPVGMVLKRNTWESIADLVGHGAPSTCCRFNPQAMLRQSTGLQGGRDGDIGAVTPLNTPKKDKKKRVACTVALGDQSGVVSVWTTGQNTPLLVLDDVFNGPVLDISWASWKDSNHEDDTVAASSTSDSGKQVFACCSMDGTVVVVVLCGQGVTGGQRAMHRDELESHLRALYGCSTMEMIHTPEALLDGPTVLQYKKKATQGSASRSDGSVEISSDTISAPPVLSVAAAVAAGMDMRMSGPNGSVSSSSTVKQTTTTAATATATAAATMTRNVRESSKGGKKRIQPMVVAEQDSSHIQLSHPSTTANASSGPVMGSGTTAAVICDISNVTHIGQQSSGVRGSMDTISNTSQQTQPQAHANGHVSGYELDGTSKRPRLATPSSSVHVAPSAHAISSFTFQHDATVCRTHVQSGDDGLSVPVMLSSSKAYSRGLANLLNHPTGRTLTLHAKLLSRPRELSTVKNFGLQLTSLSLRDISSSATSCPIGNNRESTGICSDAKWECHVSGVVTALCGIQISSTRTTSCTGVCVIGTSDGGLQLFSLECGMRISPVLVLGTAIAFVDAVEVTSSGVIRILAATADGDVHVYKLTRSSFCSDGGTADNGVPNSGLSLDIKTSVRPVLMSMQQQHQHHHSQPQQHSGQGATTGSSDTTSTRRPAVVWLEKCFLAKDSGDIAILMHCDGAEGGAWQCFQFSNTLETWIRVIDMRGFLCGHFLSHGKDSLTATLTHSGASNSLSALSAHGGVNEMVAHAVSKNSSVRDIAQVSRALMTATTSAKDYTHKLSLCHVEERLCVTAATSKMQEARHWLAEWVLLCCQLHETHRIRWLANQLISRTTSASASGDGAVDMGWGWMGGSHKALILGMKATELLVECIMPAIATSGCAQEMLVELQDALNLLISSEQL